MHIMTVKAILGSEHENAIINALRQVLRKMGAEEGERHWTVAGSQEVSTVHYILGAQPLTVEAETYIGLSITGDSEIVATIAAQVRDVLESDSKLSGVIS